MTQPELFQSCASPTGVKRTVSLGSHFLRRLFFPLLSRAGRGDIPKEAFLAVLKVASSSEE